LSTNVAVHDFSVEVEVWEDEPTALAGRWWSGQPGVPALVCLPGGTYDHRYFDLDVAGGGYSFACAFVDRGYTVVAFDQLGTGGSTWPRHETGLAEQARAAAGAVEAVRKQLPGGTAVVGVGHSMGGYVAMVQQASARSYDAVAILGTTVGVVGIIPLPEELVNAAAGGAAARRALVEQMLPSFADQFIPGDRTDLLAAFHLDDLPPAVREADVEQTTTVCPRLAAAEATVPYITAEAAAAIEVPVFLGYGEVDVSLSPHDEPSYFANSDDVTLFVLPGSAHCHNMANTRTVLWDRMDRWITALALVHSA
jgi:pimeloyl-ACP methyl ester carboxylesterase